MEDELMSRCFFGVQYYWGFLGDSMRYIFKMVLFGWGSWGIFLFFLFVIG